MGAGRKRRVIICLGPPLPAASSGSLETGRGRWPTVVPGPCSRPGFTEPASLDAAGALLPHPCTLACAPWEANLPRGPSAVCFCGTVLTVARTGRYPAGLAIGEPGLSSTGPGGRPEGRRRSDRDHLACFLGWMLAAAGFAPGGSQGQVGWGGPASGLRAEPPASCGSPAGHPPEGSGHRSRREWRRAQGS